VDANLEVFFRERIYVTELRLAARLSDYHRQRKRGREHYLQVCG
jgi:hypothetical protein